MIKFIYGVIIVITILDLIYTVFYAIKKSTKADELLSPIIIIPALFFLKFFPFIEHNDNTFFYVLSFVSIVFLIIRFLRKEIFAMENMCIMLFFIFCNLKDIKHSEIIITIMCLLGIVTVILDFIRERSKYKVSDIPVSDPKQEL